MAETLRCNGLTCSRVSHMSTDSRVTAVGPLLCLLRESDFWRFNFRSVSDSLS
jgi:hypothetical protein